MGIRDIAMGQEKKQKPLFDGYHGYPEEDYNPRSDYNPRYDGFYDGSKYRVPEPEPTNLITIGMIVTYQEMGPQFDMDNERYEYEPSGAEFRAKEIAYDRLTNLIGKGFESKYSIVIDAVDDYTGYEISIILTPLEDKKHAKPC